MDKILAIIPARSGSKGLPDKNIRLLNGKPLLAYAVEVAKQSSLIDRIVVATDSEEYAAIGYEFGANVEYMRPKEISGDNSFPSQLMENVLDSIDFSPEIVVYLQPTTPIRTFEVIDDAISTLMSYPDIYSLAAINTSPSSGWRAKTLDGGFLKGYKNGTYKVGELNRQHAPQTYGQNGYVSVYHVSGLYKSGFKHGEKVIGFKTPDSVDIDTINDFDYLEYLMRNK